MNTAYTYTWQVLQTNNASMDAFLTICIEFLSSSSIFRRNIQTTKPIVPK